MNTYFIREEMAKDRNDVYHMHTLAFGGTAEARLADDLRKSGDAVISFVALKDERIIGHIMLNRLKAPLKALTMAPFAVHPEFQGQGVGLSLIRKALDRAQQGGWTAVFVLGGTDYYERMGFTLHAADEFSPPYGAKHFISLPAVSLSPSSGK